MAMAMVMLQPLCLLVCFLVGVARSELPVLQKLWSGGAAENAQTPPGADRTLSAPIIGHDGRLIACSGKNLLAFERNGSVAWIVPLGHRCNEGIGPVTEGGKVYLVAEDKVIKVTPQNVHTAEAASEVFFSYNATPGRSEEIIGLSISGDWSSLFLTIRNRGLFTLLLCTGELQWSLGPMLDWFGYRLGCKKNISNCYFDSAPVVDHCEGALYISNTEGQLYSLYIHSRQYRWIQDLSSLDKAMTIAPGNSGRLYIIFQRKSIVVGLDVSTGNISWQQNLGPLSNEKSFPTVDSNGWMSIGSLDGYLYSISPDGDIRKFVGKTAHDSVIHASPVLDCSGFSMYVAQTIMEAKSIRTIGDHTYVSAMKPSRILFTLLAPATGTIYWTGEYPGGLSNLLSSSDLNDFMVDETILLTVLSAARIGNTLQCYTRREKIAWTCRQAKANFSQTDPGDHNLVLVFLLFNLVVIVIQAVAVRFCCIFWRKKKLQGNGLQKFLRKRRSLHNERRVLGKMISELEQKAVKDASSNETLEQLGEMVKAKEGVERRLYTSYSLGRDRLGLTQGSSILPLYHGKYKSHSFHSSQKESITIFNTFSDTSTSGNRTSSYSDNSESCSATSSGDMDLDARSRSAEEAGPSNTANVSEGVQDECPSDVKSPYRVFTNPVFVEEHITASSGNVLPQREELTETMKDFIPSKRIWLKRRRTLSFN
ncbi:protein GAMETE EXPRESSED 3 [Phragmites australis]|uniref:protein GAMETE EXPRESSED 3 n=1 Tax=Phragmites australis TaxID=29695 RepID=UPI002D77DD66|nr:protein GAMETE EXPRESSED 3 [Phragmites australis]